MNGNPMEKRRLKPVVQEIMPLSQSKFKAKIIDDPMERIGDSRPATFECAECKTHYVNDAYMEMRKKYPLCSECIYKKRFPKAYEKKMHYKYLENHKVSFNKTGYRGVVLISKDPVRYRARIKAMGRDINLGDYKTAIDAAYKFDRFIYENYLSNTPNYPYVGKYHEGR